VFPAGSPERLPWRADSSGRQASGSWHVPERPAQQRQQEQAALASRPQGHFWTLEPASLAEEGPEVQGQDVHQVGPPPPQQQQAEVRARRPGMGTGTGMA
jgi:hypothetical protein